MKKDFKAIVSEVITNHEGSERFVIIDSNTHEVLDNNDGRGYTTENKAITVYSQKHGIKTQKEIEKKRTVEIKHATDIKKGKK